MQQPPQGGIPRCVDASRTLAFSKLSQPGFRAIPGWPPDSPWRTMRAGARRRSRTRRILRGPIRVWRPSCCIAEEKASKPSSSWSNLFRRTHGRKSPCARRGKNANLLETIMPAGAGIRLPGGATSLVTGPRRTACELEIKAADGGAAIDGVVALSGLPKTLQSLNAECVQK